MAGAEGAPADHPELEGESGGGAGSGAPQEVDVLFAVMRCLDTRSLIMAALTCRCVRGVFPGVCGGQSKSK